MSEDFDKCLQLDNIQERHLGSEIWEDGPLVPYLRHKVPPLCAVQL